MTGEVKPGAPGTEGMEGIDEVTDTLEFEFDPKEWLQLLGEKKHAELGRKILDVLDIYHKEKFNSISMHQLGTVEFIAKLILRIFADPDFMVESDLAPHFMERKTVMANMIRFTSFHNADVVIKEIINQPNNFAKLLILYSHYSKLRLDLEELFKLNQYLTSLWVSEILISRNWGGEDAYEMCHWVATHPAVHKYYVLDDLNKYFPVTEDTAYPYFFVSYIAPEAERVFRRCINTQMQQRFHYDYPLPEPDFGKILVVSMHMRKGHAIYRSLAPQLYALKEKYTLDLFHLHMVRHEGIDYELFDTVHHMDACRESIDKGFTHAHLQNILSAGYGAIYYTDVGLTRPSIINANLRLAPIQVTSYGHPASTHGTQIDYYIGGRGVEAIDKAKMYYSEKLVLIPGLGVEPDHRPYEQKEHPDKDTERVYIMCSWGELKINYPLLRLLKEMLRRSSRKLCFEFVGLSMDRFTKLSIEKELVDTLGGENIHVIGSLKLEAYLSVFEACDFAIDAYPFGSYNRVVDALQVGTPLVAYEGDRAYNRLAGALLRQVGLEELVAKNEEEYVEKSLKLIEDEDYRLALTARVRQLPLESVLYGRERPKYFRDAFDAIIADHKANQGEKTTNRNRTPIIIPE